MAQISDTPEKQLNLIIARYHEDTASLRRHMTEHGILERDGGSVFGKFAISLIT
jgi:hypothetical protein